MKSETLAAALRLAAQGWPILPVHHPRSDGSCSCARSDCRYIGKHPRIAGWLDDATTSNSVINGWLDVWPDTNIGVAFGRKAGVIDIEVDPRSNGELSLKHLEGLLGKLPSTRRFRSGGGGFHYIFIYPGEKRLRKATHVGKDLLGTETTGVDVISDGGMAVVPPSLHISGKHYVWENPDMAIAQLPVKWVNYLADPDNAADPTTDIGAAILGELNNILPDVNIPVAKDFLSFLDANMEYGAWMRVGQALKLQFGDSPEALDLFDEWSATATDKYPGREEIEKQWESYGKGRNATATFRTIIEMAKEGGWRPPTKSIAPKEEKQLRQQDAEQYKAFAKLINEACDDTELNDAASQIRKTELFDATRDQLVDDYQDAFTRLHPGKKISRTSVGELLDDASEKEQRAKELSEADGWFKPYIYLSDHRQGNFYNSDNGTTLSPQVFDANYSAKLITPIMRAQGKLAPIFLPSMLVLNAELIPKVQGLRYRPGLPIIFSDQGVQYANRYQKQSGEALDPMLWNEHEQAAVKRIEDHGRWLLGEERLRTMRQFLAYLYNKPTERVRWCYVIIGPKGIGKTFWGHVARVALGHNNVNDIGPSTLSHTDFNGWAEGAQLNIIEEVRVEGMRKSEIMDSLKAAITNDWIDIHRKGLDAYQTRNTASYLAFTNHYNALHVDSGDRRYFITHTNHATVDSFKEDLGGSEAATEYFNELFGALNQGDAIRGWLASTDMTDFKPNSAPYSQELENLANHSKSDLEEAILTVISEGARNVSEKVVELNALKAKLMMIDGIGDISGQRIGRTLLNMGFSLAAPATLRPYGQERSSRWYLGPNVKPTGSPTEQVRALSEAK